mmetsp:Transcript_16103/g.60963  ORF Transcript_16103/g.60963 Transcript_16103/m.60963 type:complete len:251 (-) Transcript_16103:786-1538(-)
MTVHTPCDAAGPGAAVIAQTWAQARSGAPYIMVCPATRDAESAADAAMAAEQRAATSAGRLFRMGGASEPASGAPAPASAPAPAPAGASAAASLGAAPGAAGPSSRPLAACDSASSVSPAATQRAGNAGKRNLSSLWALPDMRRTQPTTEALTAAEAARSPVRARAARRPTGPRRSPGAVRLCVRAADAAASTAQGDSRAATAQPLKLRPRLARYHHQGSVPYRSAPEPSPPTPSALYLMISRIATPSFP